MKNEKDYNSILVSVIMCVYNTDQRFLIDAVKSILAQTHSFLELIIVDDCSSLNLYDNIIFENNKIKILRNDKNYGPSFSRNRAIDVCKGEYIAIMDSDDISLPMRLEKQVAFMENNPDVVACGSWFKFIGDKSHEVKRNINDHEYYKCCLLFGNSPTILNPSVMIRKATLGKHKIRFDEKLRYGEDYKLWYELSKIGRVTNYEEILVFYRVHNNQATYKNHLVRRSAKSDSVVKKEMMNELGVELSPVEEDVLFNFIYSKKYNPNLYIKLLNRLLNANRTTKIYDQNKLMMRVHEQWILTIQNVKNPFKFICLFFSQKGMRKELIKIKVKQLFN